MKSTSQNTLLLLQIHVFLLIRKRVEVQAKIADAFLERFQLKPEEIKVLRGSRGVSITEVRIS